jgi:hypothetical protein
LEFGGELPIYSSAALAAATARARRAQAEWQAELLDGSSALVESAGEPGALGEWTFETPVADASSYTVRVRVRDGSGLWSAWDSVAFSVSYLPPADVILTGSYTTGLGVNTITLTADATNPGVTVDPVSVAIERRIDGGEWRTIASALDPNATFVDTTCATIGLNEYRPIVTSALPSSVTGSILEITTADTRWSYVAYGPGFGTMLRCYGSLEFGQADGREIVFTDFENRPEPHASFGRNTSSTMSVKTDLDGDSTPLVDWRLMAREAETVLIKTPAGRRDFGAVTGLSGVESHNAVTPLTFNFTVSDYDG